MWTRRIGRLVAGSLLTVAVPVGAQSLDPPPRAAADAPPGAARERPAPAPSAAAPSPLAEPSDWAETPASSPTDDPAQASHSQTTYDAVPEESGKTPEERAQSLGEASGLLGATGLMRTMSAASGAPGTFRFSLLTGFYSGSRFLCPECPNQGQNAEASDKVNRVSANLFLSATITDFLETYAGVFSHSTSTNRPVDQLKQVVGDWDLGVKLFMPAERGQIFTAGGALDLGFSTGSGQVGISGIGAVNLGVRGLGTADFSKSSDPLPLRANVNLSYFFDNSAKLVSDFERRTGTNVDRIERFSLDINRVDFIKFGLGAEGLFESARPFLEWSIDIPANRQGYTCARQQAPSGDGCLRDRAGFATTPSRLSAGLRVMPWKVLPWWLEGMTLTGALDLATGGASDFLVEVAPEVPWTLWFGLGYAADTQPRIKVQQVPSPIPTPPPELAVHGIVIEKDTTTAIADALIHFDGRDVTGLISTANGHFVTGPLDPGSYTFRIAAPGYKDGKCSIDVVAVAAPGTAPVPPGGPETAPGVSPAPAGAPADPPPAPASALDPSAARGLASRPNAAEPPPGISLLTCELEPVPRVSNLNGRVSDGNTGEPIGNATVRITDVLARQLELQVDEVGAFRFENVPPGAASITITAPGYLKSVIRLNVEPLQELDQRFPLAPVPTKPGIRINKQQLDLTSPIVFAEGSAKLSRDALFTIQELAPFLEAHPELTHVEVQSHTADPGPAGTTLSNDRANAIRDALVLHGVAATRITARGYGGSTPLVPAENDAARHKNERIVFKLDSGADAAKAGPDAPKAGAAAPKAGAAAPKPSVTIPGLELPKTEPVAPKPVPTPPKL